MTGVGQPLAESLEGGAEVKSIPPSSTEPYSSTRDLYDSTVYNAIREYLTSPGSVVRSRNFMRRGVVERLPAAFYAGYIEAGGEDTEDEDEVWLTARINEELGYVDSLFMALKSGEKGLRDFPPPNFSPDDEAAARTASWLSSLDGVYTEGKFRGAGNVMLTFDGPDGEKTCPECQKYKGKRHSAKWWLKRDLVRRSGNDNFTCGRWDTCQHEFYTDGGDLYSGVE